MDMSEEIKNTLREFQEYQQQLRMILTQKTQLEMRFAETKKALDEISKHNPSEVYKIVGQVMLKTDSDKAKKGLDDEAEIIDVRLKSLKKQETSLPYSPAALSLRMLATSNWPSGMPETRKSVKCLCLLGQQYDAVKIVL